jgi:hypothetical protein
MSSRVHVPGSFLLLLGATFLLVVLVLYHFFIQNALIWKRPQTLGKAQLKLRVWTNKATGLYYCSDSALSGQTALGRYMSQEEALQHGYTPARKEPCR